MLMSPVQWAVTEKTDKVLFELYTTWELEVVDTNQIEFPRQYLVWTHSMQYFLKNDWLNKAMNLNKLLLYIY
jgi:hypothetical protein